MRRSTRQEHTKTGISKQIGPRIRARRLAVGMTQKQLGAKIGVTYQQVQRYEHGTDRLTVDRLYEIAIVLEVAPGMLFPSKAGALTNVNGVVSNDEFMRLMDRPDTIQMLRAWSGIRDSKRRAALIDMVLAYADKYAIKAWPSTSV
jgi:transcriptional regulator with XRE-family HTH domain